ncbi:RNA helicase [Malassezia cuniculi]|uniref:RNA helicase n=1 Tax=Malassezia cuniculi TaxID=948313 RepID=A0AAF0EM87_9BASI|nr:RNA helicase [Malassezia cuniculi]
MRASEYVPRRAHKKALNALYWTLDQRQKPARWKGKWSANNDWDLEARLALVIDDKTFPLRGNYAEPFSSDTQRLQVELRPADATDEKYQLFCKYQVQVHREEPGEQDFRSWKRFLVESPFPPDRNYGTFHQDSVYLYYDPEFTSWQLGTISALREIALTRQLQRGVSADIAHYYLGFYIESCQKMRPVFRTSIEIDKGVVATGDGRTIKEAGNAAALHGMFLLMENGSIDDSPTSTANPTADGVLPDGSPISFERAREFLDYFCHHGHFGSPEIAFSGVEMNSRGNPVIVAWRATVMIGGVELATAKSNSKKNAQNSAIVPAAIALASQEPDVYKLFASTHKPGAPIGKTPSVRFNTSDDTNEQIRDLYDQVRSSELYTKHPKVTAALRGDSAEPQTTPKSRVNRSHQLSESGHAAKSARMLESLNAYQTDESVRQIREQRQSLPVMQQSGDVLVKIELNPVIVCMAATGSGKTTQVPQILLDDYILREQGSRCNIICTQPRRIAAISVAQRVADERGEPLGKSIGYQVRFDSRLPNPHGSITFCTTGIILRRLQSAMADTSGSDHAWLDNITHIVMDEVHERDIETDLLLVIIKRILLQRRAEGKREIKLVLMSATVDPQLFQEYFAELSPSGRAAPVVEIPGRSYPVEKYFLNETVSRLQALQIPQDMGGYVWQDKGVREYIQRETALQGSMASDHAGAIDASDSVEIPLPLVALMIADVLNRSQDGHVLVFLTGWDDMKSLHEMLLNVSKQPLLGLELDNPQKYEVHLLHSNVSVQDQQAVFAKPRDPSIRRIILSTNIAETSVTIPDVVYVIDTGRVKEKRYDPERHLSSLVSAWVGTSNLHQRAGRAGRHRPGEYYSLVSHERYARLSVHQTVEMKRSDLSNVVMQIKALDFPNMDVQEVLNSAIEPPDAVRVRAALNNLERVGAIDYNGHLTSLGRILLQLPLDVAIGKMCLYGAIFRCLDPVITLAAILTSRDPFMSPIHLKKESDTIRDNWSPVFFRSDPISVLNAYSQWSFKLTQSSHQASRFLYDNMLSRTTMNQIQQVKAGLFQSLIKANVIDLVRSSTQIAPRYRRRLRESDPEFNLNAGSTPLLCGLIAVALAPNFAVRKGDRLYRTEQEKTCMVHPSSVCHYKYDRERRAHLPKNTEVLIYAEKSRNVSTGTQGSTPTFLRGCSRIDPLAFMLFGASDLRVVADGLECDGWLPVTGYFDALDNVERLKSAMDLCILRVFEGIGKRRQRQDVTEKAVQQEAAEESTAGEMTKSTSLAWDSDEDKDSIDANMFDRSLSPRELEEIEQLTSGVVRVMDAYATELLEQVESTDAPSSLDAHTLPRRPARRDSLNIKGLRRVSQLRDGTSAYPHADVPDEALYRHCSDQVPPVVRMKHLLNWTLHRSTEQALGGALPQRRIRPGRKDPSDALLSPPPAHVQSPVSEYDSQKYAEAAPIITRVIDETLRDLNDGMIGISWLQQSRERPQQLQPHPRNESNKNAVKQLEGMLSQLEKEYEAWNAQERAIDALDQETRALTEQVNKLRAARGSADEDAEIMDQSVRALDGKDVLTDIPSLAWKLDDVDEQTKAHLEYALGVLHSVAALDEQVASQDTSAGTPGSELDPRIQDLEFAADRLESQLYSVVQLDELAQRYIAQVSARAAQTLAERATAGLATFTGTDTLTRLESESDEPLGQSDVAIRQQRLDELMAGVRDSCPSDSAEVSSVTHSDTRELLRALASRVDGR